MITDLPKGASGPVWSPDGTRIAFESSTTQEDLQKAQQQKNAKPGDGQAESEHESDVHVITRAVYRSNDAGYLDPKRQAISGSSRCRRPPMKFPSRCSSPAEISRRVNHSGATMVHAFTSPRGASPNPTTNSHATDIYSVPATGGNSEKLATVPMSIGDLVLSPDGDRLAFHGAVSEPVRSYSQVDLWVMEVKPGGESAKPYRRL